MVTSISASGEKLECMDVAAQSRELPCTPSVPAGTTRELPGWFFHFKKELCDIMLVLHLATPPILFMLRLLKAFYI